MTDKISVQHSDTHVLITIFCKDTIEAQEVAAEIAADVNNGKFRPAALEPRETERERENTTGRHSVTDDKQLEHDQAEQTKGRDEPKRSGGMADGPIPVRK